MNTNNDVLRERLIYGAELVGDYQFPQLPSVNAHITATKVVPFNACRSEKNPRQSIAHFYIEDAAFERVWNQPDKYLDILRNFQYVITPDFSTYSGMPRVLQLYNTYRNRALAYWFDLNNIKIIPNVGWGGAETFDYCFDGLPQNSTLAVSTNGCFSKQGKLIFQQGFNEMIKRLSPNKVVIIGREIPLETDVELIYFPSFGQDMTNRLRGDTNGK